MSAFVAGAEKRMMPVGEGAALRALREVCPQPLLLRRANVHRNAAVQSNDVPVAEVVAVVAFPRRARGGAEVVEITSGACRVVIVVARDRPGASLEPPPRGAAGAGAKVVKIPGGACRVVIVFAGDRPGASLEPTPRGVVAVLVVAA